MSVEAQSTGTLHSYRSPMSIHHIAALLAPAWGHTVSYIHLARQMLQQDPDLVITIVQHNIMVAQMEAELRTSEYDPARLRIVGVGNKNLTFLTDELKGVLDDLVAGWLVTLDSLVKGNGEWPTPRTLHLDFFGGGAERSQEIAGPGCKMLMWWSSSLVSLPTHVTDYDFAAITEEIYADEERRQGRSKDEILNAVGLALNGTDRHSGLVVKAPGITDMYDYERSAHATGQAPDGFARVLSSSQSFAKMAAGYIVPTTTCFEPIGVPYWKEFCKSRGQEFFPVGMQAHDACWTNNSAVSPTNETIRAFLEQAVCKYGQRSVLYISFGSIFFPTSMPGHVAALVETLLNLEKPFPFLFALGGKLAALPQELIERINSSGRGLACSFWVEQRAVLQSGAVGWFLTHGGFNSTTESLSQGIPLIVWPMDAEQPMNAALLSQEPSPVGIELLQVRAGVQLGPSLRGGPTITGSVSDAAAEFKAVFEAARGTRGAVITANAVKLAKALREARRVEAAAEIRRLAAF